MPANLPTSQSPAEHARAAAARGRVAADAAADRKSRTLFLPFAFFVPEYLPRVSMFTGRTDNIQFIPRRVRSAKTNTPHLERVPGENKQLRPVKRKRITLWIPESPDEQWRPAWRVFEKLTDLLLTVALILTPFFTKLEFFTWQMMGVNSGYAAARPDLAAALEFWWLIPLVIVVMVVWFLGKHYFKKQLAKDHIAATVTAEGYELFFPPGLEGAREAYANAYSSYMTSTHQKPANALAGVAVDAGIPDVWKGTTGVSLQLAIEPDFFTSPFCPSMSLLSGRVDEIQSQFLPMKAVEFVKGAARFSKFKNPPVHAPFRRGESVTWLRQRTLVGVSWGLSAAAIAAAFFIAKQVDVHPSTLGNVSMGLVIIATLAFVVNAILFSKGYPTFMYLIEGPHVLVRFPHRLEHVYTAYRSAYENYLRNKGVDVPPLAIAEDAEQELNAVVPGWDQVKRES